MLENLFAEDDKRSASSTTNGLVKPPEPRAASGFVGLKNQGATCYLNSLIQAMYMTPELRFGLYAINPTELGSDIMDEYEKQKKADEKKGMIEADEAHLDYMKKIGMEEIGCRKALIATKNNVEEAMNYYWEHSESDPNFNKETAVDESKRKKRKPRYIPLELQRLFTQLEQLNERAISTEDLTSRGFQWQGTDGRVQHDAHELNRLLIDALERSLKHTSGEKLSKMLYEGLLSNQIKCTGCHNLSSREELFYDLNVQVQDCPDLVHALRQYTAAEVMEGDSAYACDTCSSKQRALRSAVLKKLPPVLTLSCNRFKYDKTTWQREKILARSEFPLLLNMADFKVDNGSLVAGKPIPSPDDEDGKARLAQLKSNMVWIQDVWNTAQTIAADLLNTYGEEVSVSQIPTEQLEVIAKQLNSVESFIESNVQRSISSGGDPTTAVDDIYQLFAVIMHRGSAHSGHYFAYIRDSLNQGNWSIPLSEYTTRFLSASSSGVGSGGSGSKARDTNIYHFLDPDGYFIMDNTSAISKLVLVFQTSHGSVGRNYKPIAFNHLGKVVKSSLGDTWNNLYRDAHGTLNEFLKKHDDMFITHATTYVLRSDHEIRLVPPQEFAKRLALHLSTNAGSQPVNTGESKSGAVADQVSVSVPVPSTVVDGAVDTSSDGMLARQLNEEQEIDDDLVSAVNSNAAITDELEHQEEWHTQESKKSKNKKKSSGDNSSVTSSSSKPVNTNGKNERVVEDGFDSTDKNVENSSNLLAQQSRIYKLASELMNVFHGQYFEFNDSEVKPMPIVHLERAFEGRDSAYLLVYRKVTTSSSTRVAPVISSTSTDPKDGAPMDIETGEFDTLQDEEDAVVDDFVDKDSVAIVGDDPGSSASVPSSTSSGNPAFKKKSKSADKKQKANGKTADSVYLPPTVYLTEQNLAQVSGSSSSLIGIDSAFVRDTDSKSSHNANRCSPNMSAGLVPVVPPPAFWASKVAVMNAELEAARSLYETNKRSIKVQILCPYHVSYSAPYFYRAIDKEFSFGDINDTIPESMKNHVELEVDNTLTVSELIAKLMEHCNDCKDELKLTLKQEVITITKSSKRKSASSQRQSVSSSDERNGTAGHDDKTTPSLVLSELQSIGNGLYPLDTLKPDSILQKALSPSVTLLAWNGATFDSSVVATGIANKPVPIKFSVLTFKDLFCTPVDETATEGVKPRTTRSKTSSTNTVAVQDANAVTSAVSVVSPQDIVTGKVEECLYSRSTTLLELCEDLYSKFNGTIKRPCFHLVNKQASKLPVILPSRTRSGVPTNEKSASKGLLSQLLWRYSPNTTLTTNAPSSALPLVKNRSNTAANVAAGDVATLSLTIGDMIDGKNGKFSGDEILIEESEPSVVSGLYSGWLADAEVSRRNSTWSVTVEIEVSHRDIEQYLLGESKSTVVEVDLTSPSKPQNGTIAIDLTADEDVPIFTSSGGASDYPPAVTIEFTSNTSLRTVKETVLQRIGYSDPKYREVTRFRKGILRGENVADDEDKSLAEFGLHDNCTLFLELGKLASTQIITIQAASITGNDTRTPKVNPLQPGKRSAESDFDIPLRMTVIELRDMLGCHFHKLNPGWTLTRSPESSAVTGLSELAAPSYRLRSTDMLGNSAKLLFEEGNKGEAVTLESAGIIGGSILLLEEGDVPIRGQLTVTVYLWSLAPFKPIPTAAPSDSGSNRGDNTPKDTAQIEGGVEVVDATEVEPGKPDEIETVERTRRQHLHLLGDISIHEDKNMGDLQSQVFRLMTELSAESRAVVFEGLEAPVDETHFLLRELRNDMLPGRCLWACSLPKDTQQNTSSTFTGRGGQTVKSSTLSTQNTPLKKLSFLKSEIKLAVEILPKAQETVRPPSTCIRVWAQRLTNPYGTEEGKSVMDPFWPPVEVTINGGPAPTTGFLKSKILAKLWPGGETKSISVHRYETQSVKWTEIVKGKSDNILGVPISLKDGDLICAFVIDTGNSHLSTTLSKKAPVISRPEDKYLKLQQKTQKKSATLLNVTKSAAGTTGPATTAAAKAAQQKKRKQVVEVALTLGGDLDFSEDEADDDN